MRKLLELQMPQAGLQNLVVLSNRAPYVWRGGDGETTVTRAVSGLVSALEPVMNACGGTWIGWGGRVAEQSRVGARLPVPPERATYALREVILGREEYQRYYHGFANGCLWPLFHCFIDKADFDHQNWRSYLRVNLVFAGAALMEASEDALVWVHDYHLALVPGMLRNKGYGGKIAFFLHIPFPPPEIYSTLPWGREILQGLLGCDLIAFHLPGYAENFLRAVERLLKAEVDYTRGWIRWRNRNIMASALPIGIDYVKFEELARSRQTGQRAEQIRREVGARRLVLGVERLDYTKGIIEKLRGIGEFFNRYPEYRDDVVFLQVAVPSRAEARDYAGLRSKVEELVGRVNGQFSAGWRVPVRYKSAALDSSELVAHYCAADVMLVTPLRDGLNLVAKEYVACRTGGDGVLVLSPFAGAAEQLKGCIQVNPYDRFAMAEMIKKAVTMPEAEQKARMMLLQHAVRQYDLRWWWRGVLAGLDRGGAGMPPAKTAAARVAAGSRLAGQHYDV